MDALFDTLNVCCTCVYLVKSRMGMDILSERDAMSRAFRRYSKRNHREQPRNEFVQAASETRVDVLTFVLLAFSHRFMIL